MWATHKSLLLRQPWRTWVCSSGDRVWRWHNCLNLGNTRGARWAGKSMAMGAEDITLLGAFLSPVSGTLCAVLTSPSNGSWWHVGRERLQGGFTPCMWLNSSALVPWQSSFPPKAFHLAYFLPPLPLGCLPTAGSSVHFGIAFQFIGSISQDHAQQWACIPGQGMLDMYMDCVVLTLSRLTDQLLHSLLTASSASLLHPRVQIRCCFLSSYHLVTCGSMVLSGDQVSW